jgi:type VI secretion system secreted protein Hcp
MAAVDYFLKIKGIEGESTDKAHGKEIDILSWSWGASNMGSHASGGGGGAGKVSFQDFSFAMKVNKASPKLLLSCASGDHIPEALLTCRKAGKTQQEYLKIKFTEIHITSFQTGGSQGEVVPVDSISINFGKMEYEYYPQKPDGSLDAKVPVHWSVKENIGG